MTAWQYWKEDIARKLSAQIGTTVEPAELVVPPDAKMGDLAFGCFRLAKEQKINPAALAKNIAQAFQISDEIVSVSAAGPYVNFTLGIDAAVARVVRDIETAGDRYGASVFGDKKQVLLECANPNTHKEIHVGHARHLLIGVALKRLLTLADWKVVVMGYHGDVGAHVAKCLWQLARSNGFATNAFTEKDAKALIKKIPKAEHTGKFLGRVYTEASRALDEDPDKKDEVSEVQRKLEAHDAAWEIIWKETRQWSIEEMNAMFAKLNVALDRQYFESEVTDRGQEMVDDLLKKNVAKESQGAIVVDLDDVKLGVFLVRKSDGTSLYGTKDLALAELKLKEYPEAARSILLVDNRQAFYFKQLFETLRRIGLTPVPEHVGYEFVTLKTGAMSSREGNIVTLQSFLDEVFAFARAEVAKRHPEWNERKLASAAETIAMAGVTFGMLKQDSDKIITFDLEQALAFDGATGPYIQYAATRLGSILKKAKIKPKTTKELSHEFSDPSEKLLALKLAQFPTIAEAAAKELRPSILAQWCLEAAQRANDFYRDVPVLESSGTKLEGRLRLVAAARAALEQGLYLLGISLPDEM